jgi:imidazolonepropionase-like amidohydrolase
VANPVVLIQDGKIASVGSNLTIPTGYQVVDLGSATILPGLIDCHTHLLHYYDETYTNDLAELSEKSTALRALMGSVLARGMLKAGFTTVRDLGNSGFNGDVALRTLLTWVM